MAWNPKLPTSRPFVMPPYGPNYLQQNGGADCMWFVWELVYQLYGLRMYANYWGQPSGCIVTADDGTKYAMSRQSAPPLVPCMAFAGNPINHVAWLDHISLNMSKGHWQVTGYMVDSDADPSHSMTWGPSAGTYFGCTYVPYTITLLSDQFVNDYTSYIVLYRVPVGHAVPQQIGQ